jgi:hypothetical protein
LAEKNRRDEAARLPQESNAQSIHNSSRLEALKAEKAMRDAKLVASGGLEPTALQNFGKGFVATGVGGLADLIALPGNLAIKEMASETNKNIAQRDSARKFLEEQLPKESYSQMAGNKYDELMNIKRNPNEEPSISQTAGEILSPTPFSKFVNPIKNVGKAAKAFGKAVLESAGSATALHTLPNVTKEGSLPEDLAKTVIGAKAGSSLTNLSKALPTTKNFARIASIGADPNVEALKLAEKHGIELPVNVGMNSTPLNWGSNVLSKSVFSSKKFKESLQKSNQSMMSAVKRNIDNLGINDVEPSVAAQEFNNFLKSEENQIKSAVDVQYDDARSLLKPTDAIVPKNTIKTIDEMKEILNRDIKSPATRKVTGYVATLANAWGILPKEFKLPKGYKEGDLTPVQLDIIMKSFEKNARKIPLEKLDGVRKEINSILGHKEEVRGMEAWLKSLRNSITKDLESSTNKAYTDKLREANTFYRNSYASRFKEDIAESILNGSEPLYTYRKLNNIDNLNALERIAGESTKARELVDSLKKAKVREIFNNAFKEEGLHVGNFSRVFDKTETNQEFLKKLLGPESYKNLSEISKIAREQINSGKEILNTSSTAYVTSDLQKLSKLGIETSAALIGLFSGNPTLALGSLGSAATRIAIPNLLSRLIANPEFARMAREFAIARKNGHLKHSDVLLERLGKKTNQLIKTYQYELQKEERE